MDTEEASNNPSSVESDVNMQDAKSPSEPSPPGAENGTLEEDDKPTDKPAKMETDPKVCVTACLWLFSGHAALNNMLIGRLPILFFFNLGFLFL